MPIYQPLPINLHQPLEEGEWKLEDVSVKQKESLGQQYLPSLQEREHLQPGDRVQLRMLHFSDEGNKRDFLWIVVVETHDQEYIGVFDNRYSSAHTHGGIKLGELIPFGPEHVFAITTAANAAKTAAVEMMLAQRFRPTFEQMTADLSHDFPFFDFQVSANSIPSHHLEEDTINLKTDWDASLTIWCHMRRHGISDEAITSAYLIIMVVQTALQPIIRATVGLGGRELADAVNIADVFPDVGGDMPNFCSLTEERLRQIEDEMPRLYKALYSAISERFTTGDETGN